MRNEAAVTIQKASTAIGAGLLEEALEREGRKGCTRFLCTEPTRLEPPYTRFDSAHILQTQNPVEEPEPTPTLEELVTFNVFPAEEDLLSLAWMETMLKALATQTGPITFELYSENQKIWTRFAIPKNEEPGFRAALLGHFPKLTLQPIEEPFPELQTTECWVNELCPVGPYHRHLSLLGKEGASPLGLAIQAMNDQEPKTKSLFQVLLQPPMFDHDWHYNVENMAEAETKAAQIALLGGLSTDFSYDHELPPRLDPQAAEKVGLDVAFFATQTRYATWNTTPDKAKEFLQAMHVATGMLRFGGRTWRTITQQTLRDVLGEDGVKNMISRRVSHRPGIMLTTREVASLKLPRFRGQLSLWIIPS